MTRRRRLLRGFDSRTSSGRQLKMFVREFASGLGGEASLSEAEYTLVMQAAILAIQAQRLTLDVMSGKDIDSDRLVRLTKTLAKVLSDLGVKQQRAAAKPQTLEDHIAKRNGQKS